MKTFRTANGWNSLEELNREFSGRPSAILHALDVAGSLEYMDLVDLVDEGYDEGTEALDEMLGAGLVSEEVRGDRAFYWLTEAGHSARQAGA